MTKKNLLIAIDRKVSEIMRSVQSPGFAEYFELIQSPRRLLYLNFVMGMARGFGMAIGFTVLSAVVIYILQFFVKINIPVIGRFVAEIVRIVENSKR